VIGEFVLKGHSIILFLVVFSVIISCSTTDKVDPKHVEYEKDQLLPDPCDFDPCNPNPCTEKNRGVCEQSGETFTCKCDDGFHDVAGICTDKIVLVLSVGADRGIAHIGAIKAFRELGINFDAVFGNSMGSLVGSLYAISPNQDIESRYRKIINSIISESLLGKVKTYFLGIKNERFRLEYDKMNNRIKIEETSIPFATSFFKIEYNKINLRIMTKGNLANAVAGSINNPLIFNESIRNIENLDPGFDRISAIPVEDACKLFGPAIIYAVNVTEDDIVYSSKMNCLVKEIKVPVSLDIDPQKVILGQEPDFRIVVLRGYNAVMEQIQISESPD